MQEGRIESVQRFCGHAVVYCNWVCRLTFVIPLGGGYTRLLVSFFQHAPFCRYPCRPVSWKLAFYITALLVFVGVWRESEMLKKVSAAYFFYFSFCADQIYLRSNICPPWIAFIPPTTGPWLKLSSTWANLTFQMSAGTRISFHYRKNGGYAHSWIFKAQ